MVYFLHGDYYSYATQGLFADITDIVTEGGENSIESRLSADQKKYYTLNGGKYYALPREEGIGCMTYDIDLFEDYGLYFAKNGCPSEEGFTNAPGRARNPQDPTGNTIPPTTDCLRLMTKCSCFLIIWLIKALSR